MTRSVAPNWFIGVPTPLPNLPALHPPARFRAFVPADRHMTVAFLGGVSIQAAMRAFDVARRHAWSPILATLGPVVPFGRPDRYSALSAELDEGRDAAVALLTAIRAEALAAAGARPDKYGPRPHITLARPQRKAGDHDRDAGLAWAAEQRVAGTPVRLEALALYTWATDRRAQLFRVVARTPARQSSAQPSEA